MYTHHSIARWNVIPRNWRWGLRSYVVALNDRRRSVAAACPREPITLAKTFTMCVRTRKCRKRLAAILGHECTLAARLWQCAPVVAAVAVSAVAVSASAKRILGRRDRRRRFSLASLSLFFLCHLLSVYLSLSFPQIVSVATGEFPPGGTFPLSLSRERASERGKTVSLRISRLKIGRRKGDVSLLYDASRVV